MTDLKRLVDPELAAISKIMRVLAPLDPDRALRVLSYVKERHVEDLCTQERILDELRVDGPKGSGEVGTCVD